MKRSPKSTLSPMLPAERRAVGVVALVAVFRMLGLFALLPVLALYAAELDGATPILVGLAVGGYGLTQAALQIPLGALSDRVGRIPVIVGGLAVFALGSLLAADSETIYGVIGGRLLQGAGAISATLTALLADATREEVRTRAMAVFGIGIGSSFLLALVIGPLIAAGSGVRCLFVFSALVAVVAASLLILLPVGIKQPDKSVRLDLRTALRPPLLRLDLYVFLLHALLTACFVALPFLLTDRLELAVTDHWKVYVAALLASLIGTVPLVLADDRRGKGGTIAIALVFVLLGLFSLTFATGSVLMVLASLGVFFAGFNFLEAGLPARLSLLAHGAQRGASLGVFSSAQFLGAFAGGLAGGALLSGGRPADVFLAATLVTGAWLLIHQLSFERGALDRDDTDDPKPADSPEI